jgi:hypothetical protein
MSVIPVDPMKLMDYAEDGRTVAVGDEIALPEGGFAIVKRLIQPAGANNGVVEFVVERATEAFTVVLIGGNGWSTTPPLYCRAAPGLSDRFAFGPDRSRS